MDLKHLLDLSGLGAYLVPRGRYYVLVASCWRQLAEEEDLFRIDMTM